ncbi:ParA family protein [Phaeodactylibacter sp.]|uniref:ParA family protein n=1 Tax=Phaeodactylibacter sp. TaxID=1940289 RepID=UPI0025D7F60B|nr:ParA family protein [Phaeodactylibacter sp.]MCI5091195.1 ParA family protein [Phaeodactylibacter sp.]
MKIGILSQKGGVGKSTLTRALAVEYARNKWEVKIADMDLKQSTSTTWNRKRMDNNFRPKISVEPFSSVQDALKNQESYDLIIFDGAGQADIQTLEIAKVCDYIILPTGVTADDLEPQVKLAHELKKKGIARERIGICLSRVGSSKNELEAAQEYIEATGYTFLGMIMEKTSIGQCSDTGLAANETKYDSINAVVDKLIQNIYDRIQKLEEAEVKYG